jgi:hypothetical protein
MPVIATIHLRPIELDKRGQQQQADFLEEDAGLLMKPFL